MKMTKEQVAELLLKANEDLSNVEVLYSYGWGEPVDKNIPLVLFNIADGANYRIKDNAVKEVTLDLFDRVVVSKDGKRKGRINFVHLGNSDWDPYVVIGNNHYELQQFNIAWQLVEE